MADSCGLEVEGMGQLWRFVVLPPSQLEWLVVHDDWLDARERMRGECIEDGGGGGGGDDDAA